MKMMWLIIGCSVILLTVLLLNGCAIFGSTNYSVAFRKIGKSKIWIYRTKIGEHWAPCGSLAPGGFAGSSNYLTIPDIVQIKWKNGNGKIIEKDVKVKENLPSRFRRDRDCIVFNIDDNNNVILSFKIKVAKYKWEEIDSKGNRVDYSK